MWFPKRLISKNKTRIGFYIHNGWLYALARPYKVHTQYNVFASKEKSNSAMHDFVTAYKKPKISFALSCKDVFIDSISISSKLSQSEVELFCKERWAQTLHSTIEDLYLNVMHTEISEKTQKIWVFIINKQKIKEIEDYFKNINIVLDEITLDAFAIVTYMQTHMKDHGQRNYLMWPKEEDLILFEFTKKNVQRIATLEHLQPKALDNIVQGGISFNNCFYFYTNHMLKTLMQNQNNLKFMQVEMVLRLTETKAEQNHLVCLGLSL